MGVVYRAVRDFDQLDIALKFLHPSIAADRKHRERFLREARVATRLVHENIVDLYDYGQTDDGQVYLAMEHLEGETLQSLMERGPLQPGRALRIAFQISSALGRAHELDITHRDIKPGNIFVVDQERRDHVKLLDFGLAKMAGEIRLTASGAVFGTPEYMAPEQARSATVGPAADLYSLGCVLHEVLVGRPPFQGSTPDLILAHLHERPPRPSEVSDRVLPALDDVVLQLLEKDPADRPRDAHELMERLREVAAHLPPEEEDTLANPLVDRSQPLSLRPASAKTSALGLWPARVAQFEKLLHRIHPDGLPREIDGWLGELSFAVSSLRSRQTALDSSASADALREAEARRQRATLGRRLDASVQKELRIERELAERSRQLDGLWRRDRTLEAEVRELGAALPRLDLSGDLGDGALRSLARAGEAARELLVVRQELAELRQQVAQRENERADQRFQIDQLKGRIASISAEVDAERRQAAAATQGVDEDVRGLTDRVASLASAIVEHLMGYEEVRSELADSQLAV
jgi:serine/threonine protein kinase/predicted  nucleic acid-binding Zn-ribbon protein